MSYKVNRQTKEMIFEEEKKIEPKKTIAMYETHE